MMYNATCFHHNSGLPACHLQECSGTSHEQHRLCHESNGLVQIYRETKRKRPIKKSGVRVFSLRYAS